jgi:hypothetical protein
LIDEIDGFLEFLAVDGQTHSIQEIAEILNVPRTVCKSLTDFLIKYRFIKLIDSQVMIRPEIRSFILASSEELTSFQNVPSVALIASIHK